MDFFVGFFRESRDAVEEAEARAMVAEGKVIELEEAIKATEAKVEEVQFEAHKEIKSLKAEAKMAEQEASKARAWAQVELAKSL